MTLQQKLLAKQSKKGFTLVELVVVIAILAILAAIAIPAVIGIINSASTSAGESDAATLNSGCKTVYSGVKSGTIVKGDKDAGGNSITWATEKGASATKRTAAAGAVTIDQVQAYNGTAIALDDMYYQKKTDTAKSITAGTIIFNDSGTAATGTDKVTGTLTLSKLYANADNAT